VGASFGFGGKLITFNAAAPRMVTVNQVVTDPELVAKSTQLEQTLAQGNYADYCRQKADQCDDQTGRYIWYFLKANFEANPRAEMLNLLGEEAEQRIGCLGGEFNDGFFDLQATTWTI
jgi:protein transport protein SEC31